VAGNSVAAVLALFLLLRPAWRTEFGTGTGWRFDPELFRRLMRFGLPSGLFLALDTSAFTLFMLFVGRLGPVALNATTIAFTLNLIAYLPAMGIGQAVGVLMGQHLGNDQPDRAERSVRTGLAAALTINGILGLAFVLFPAALTGLFAGEDLKTNDDWLAIQALVPVLLRFVVVYCLFDTVNVVVSHALRGAGDTRFVCLLALTLPWPVLVIPTWAVWYFDWGLYAAWVAASSYIISQSLVLLWRFRQGKWRSMRVIEPELCATGSLPASALSEDTGGQAAGGTRGPASALPERDAGGKLGPIEWEESSPEAPIYEKPELLRRTEP
jgi:MATE family multidrug resistance protein